MPRERRPQVLLDVDRQGPQRRDVEQAGAPGSRSSGGGSVTSRSMPHRKAASVLPEPVGARISVCSPAGDGRPALRLGRGGLGERRARTRPAPAARTARAASGDRPPSARYREAATLMPGRSRTAGTARPTPGRGRRRLPGMAPYQTPECHPAFEEYCEAIFELREDDVDVIQARIAERLDVSRPAVSEMIRRMEARGPRRHRGRHHPPHHRRASSSPSGSCAATAWPSASSPTSSGCRGPRPTTRPGKWEHVISDRVEDAMIRVLGEPTTCPHGNPIPGSDYEAPDTVALAELEVGATFTVSAASPRSSSSPRACSSSSRTSSLQPGHARHGHRGVARRHAPPSRSTAATSASARSPAPARPSGW